MAKFDHIDPRAGLFKLPFDELPLDVQEYLHSCDACRVLMNTSKKTIEIYRDNEVYEVPEPLRDKLHAAIMAKLRKRSTMSERGFVTASDFETVVIGEGLTAEQVTIALQALADYFRACGGLGFSIEDPSAEVVS